MGKDWLNTPRHVSSVSVAYPQGRTWSARARSMTVQLLLAVLVVWFAVTGLTAVGLHFKPHEPSTKYVLVIDSGSSGTRMYAYTWVMPAEQSVSGSIPLVQAVPPEAAGHLVPKKEKKGLYKRVETQPGLDAFADNLAGLQATALQPLLDWARAVVPVQQHAATPLFMLGTGGLRRMDLLTRKALMSEIRKILADSGFRFQHSWAQVISGTEEGMYGWLALNYHNGLLAQQQALSPAAALGRRSGSIATPIALSLPNSLGSLDMGGSSLEMTFEVLPSSASSTGSPAAAPYSGLQNITVADHTFYLHTHTFHGYGLNEAYDRSITLLLEQQQKEQQEPPNKQHSGEQQQQQEQEQQPTQQLDKLVHPGVSGDLQHDLDQQRSSQPEGSTAAAAAPGATAGAGVGDAAAVVSLPGLSASAVLVQQQAQVDLAVAAVAGLQPEVGPPAQGTNTSSTHGVGGSSSAAVHAEHQMKADLAIAAAAGLRPELPAPTPIAGETAVAEINAPHTDPSDMHTLDLMQQRINADLAVAAAAGMLPTHTTQGDTSIAASSSSAAGGSTFKEDSNQMTSGVAAVAASTVAAAAAAPQPGNGSNSHDMHAYNSHSSSSSNDLPQDIASKHYDGWPLQHRTLHFQRRRLQHRAQRQVLLKQHSSLEPTAGFAWGTPGSTGEHVMNNAVLAPVKQQTWMQHGSLHLLHRLRHLLGTAVAPVVPPALASNSNKASTGDTDSSGTGITNAAPAHGFLVTHGRGNHNSSGGGSAASALSEGKHSEASQASQDVPQYVAGDVASNSTAGLTELWHPCLHDGYTAEYERLAYGGALPHPAKVLLRGHHDWAACLVLVDRVVNASAPCQVSHHKPYCRLGSAQPEIQGSFVALTGFYVVWKFLQVSSSAPFGALLDASKDLCSKPWTWVNKHLGSNINVERYCTWGPYTVRLLQQGLHLQDKDVRIGSGDVGWPLGAALAEASKLPEMMGKGSALYARHAWGAAEHAATSSSSAPAETRSVPNNFNYGMTGNNDPDGSQQLSTVANQGAVLEGDNLQQHEGKHALQDAAAAATAGGGGGSSLESDSEQQPQHMHASNSEVHKYGTQLRDSGNDAVNHVGAWQFSQRRSWAQAMFGSRHHINMGHVGAVFLVVVVWLSIVVYCLPTSGQSSGSGLFPLSVAFRGLHGPGKAQHALPVAAFSIHGGQSGRRIPSPSRGNVVKYMGV